MPPPERPFNSEALNQEYDRIRYVFNANRITITNSEPPPAPIVIPEPITEYDEDDYEEEDYEEENPDNQLRERAREEANNWTFSPTLPDDPLVRMERGLVEENYRLWELTRAFLFHSGFLFRCDLCRGYYNFNTTYNSETNSCRPCALTISRCPGCNRLTSQREGAECNHCVNTYVNSHTYRPPVRPRLLPIDENIPANKRLLIGVELEFETPSKIKLAKIVDDKYSFAYVKHDGSIEYGFEIVTQPFSVNWFNQNKNLFTDMLLEIERSEAHSSDRCGTHFHLSKTGFTQHHLYKFMKLLYENSPEVIKCSGRKNMNQVESYATFNAESRKDLIKKARRFNNVKLNPNRGHDKYVAVNLRNENTVEVRFFAGCANIQDFLSYYEFTIGAYNFTKDAGRSTITWPKFQEWAFRNRSTYPNLNTLLETYA